MLEDGTESLQKSKMRKYLLRLLARREYAQEELVAKLKEQGYDAAAGRELLAVFAKKGYQSDQRFAENLCRARLKGNCGWLRIRRELEQKGIGADLVAKIDQELRVWDWVGQIRVILAKRLPQQATSQDLARCQRYLLNKGFTFEQVKQGFEHEKIDNS